MKLTVQRLLGVSAAGLLAACGQPEKAGAPAPAPAEPASTPVVTIAPLGRAGLINGIAVAASDFATGRPLKSEPLANRTFSLRVPFGCRAAPQSAASDGPEPVVRGIATARVAENGDITLEALPADWTMSPLVGAAEPPAWDGVEGFWLPRPWIRTEDCGTPSTVQMAGSAPLPSLGLAAIRPTGGSRLGRPGEAYRFTLRGEADQPPVRSEAGYRLLLEGRISTWPDGQVVRCTSNGADSPPTCIAAVSLDLIAFETPAGERLSEWRPGQG